MSIGEFSFDGQGMQRVYENEKWTVGLKNWKPANDITGIDMLERHNETDELFVLLSGKCTLVFGQESNGIMEFSKVEMEPNKVYNIPKSMWHNTITVQDTKMVLIEDSNTGEANSDFYTLSEQELVQLKEVAQK